MNKAKLALYWASSCGGCEIAVLELEEKILDVAAAFDIVFWPVAVDFKVKDVAAMADEEIDLCLFNGAIRNSDNEEMAHLLKRLLTDFGIEPERLRLVWVSASEGAQWAKIANEMEDTVRGLGPLKLLSVAPEDAS